MHETREVHETETNLPATGPVGTGISCADQRRADAGSTYPTLKVRTTTPSSTPRTSRERSGAFATQRPTPPADVAAAGQRHAVRAVRPVTMYTSPRLRTSSPFVATGQHDGNALLTRERAHPDRLRPKLRTFPRRPGPAHDKHRSQAPRVADFHLTNGRPPRRRRLGSASRVRGCEGRSERSQSGRPQPTTSFVAAYRATSKAPLRAMLSRVGGSSHDSETASATACYCSRTIGAARPRRRGRL
jgi:hypothetical protein